MSSVVNGLMVNFARIKRKIDCKHYFLSLYKYGIIFKFEQEFTLENIVKFRRQFD